MRYEIYVLSFNDEAKASQMNQIGKVTGATLMEVLGKFPLEIARLVNELKEQEFSKRRMINDDDIPF